MFKWLTAGFIGSLALILTFALTDHLSAPHPIAASLFNALTNLAYGFAASYIFYFVNIYLPLRKSREENFKLLANIVGFIRFNISQFHKTYETNTPLTSVEELSTQLKNNCPMLITLFDGSYITQYGMLHPNHLEHLSQQDQYLAAKLLEHITTVEEPTKRWPPMLSSPEKTLEFISHSTISLLNNAIKQSTDLTPEELAPFTMLEEDIHNLLNKRSTLDILTKGKDVYYPNIQAVRKIEKWLDGLTTAYVFPNIFHTRLRENESKIIRVAGKHEVNNIRKAAEATFIIINNIDEQEISAA